MAGAALLEAEEAEAVDEAHHHVVEPLLPPAVAELSLLPHHPPRHHHPVHNYRETEKNKSMRDIGSKLMRQCAKKSFKSRLFAHPLTTERIIFV